MSSFSRLLSAPTSASSFCCGVLIAILARAAVAADAAPDRSTTFEKSFATVIVKNCLNCHNAADPKGGLDLTRKDGLLKGGDSGPAVVPGEPDDSFLVERITEGSMPPPKQGERLTEAEVAAVRGWVKEGVPWPAERVLCPFEFTTDRRAGKDWWSFQPVVRPQIPHVQQEQWLRNPIDAFVLRRLEDRGIFPASAADKTTFLRRVTYDLLGLPPTPDEIDDYLS